MSRSPEDESGQRRRDSVTLAMASVVNGLTAYAIAAIGSWTYGAEEFGPFANLWTVLVLAIAAVAFPIQHWIIRTVAIGGGERSVRDSLAGIGRAVTVLGVVVVGALWVLSDRLFDGTWLFALVAGVLIVESAVVGLSRGMLISRDRVRSAAMLMGGENLLRLALCCGVIIAGWGVPAYGAALLGGVGIVALFPSSVRPERTGTGGAQGVLPSLAGIGGGTLLSQVVLVSAPLVVAIQTDRFDLVTAMFATTALARAPFLIALGLGLQWTAELSKQFAVDSRVVARSSAWLAGGGIAFAAFGGFVYGALAPTVVPALFGPGTGLSTVDSAIVGAASALAVASIFVSLTLVVGDRGRSITVAWVIAVIVGAGAVIGSPSTSTTTSTAVAFLAAEVTALGTLTLFALRTATQPGRLDP